MALRGGVYVAFLVGAAVTWFMKQQADKRRKNKSNDDEVALSETELANPREVLKNSDWHVRLKAIRLIADQHSIEAIPDLTSALSDEDSDVRDAAVQALVGYNTEAVPQLLRTLKEAGSDAREKALSALAQIGSKEAFQGIADALLHDESAWIRIPAAEALGKTGQAQYVNVLSQALQDSHEEVYQAVVKALNQIGTKAARKAIEKHPYHPQDAF